MEVFINTDKKNFPEGITLAEIVNRTNNFNDKSYNVVYNDQLIKKENYEKIKVKDKDKIKILPFAMGG